MTPANILFFAACLHATSLAPYVVLVPGERTNVFTALVVSLPGLWLGLCALRGAISWRAVWPWALLGAGLSVSALVSETPRPSFLRALAFFFPAASGVLCAAALFRTREARLLLFRLLTFCFAGLAGAHLAFGVHPSFMGLHHHALAGTLLLLSAGPIHMVLSGGRVQRAVAVLLLGAGFLVCFLSGSRFVVLLPFVLIPLLLCLRGMRWRHAALGILVSVGVAAFFFSAYPDKVLRFVNYESTFYRIGGVPAAWEIVKQRPLLGIGLRTPRRSYLESFTPPLGTVSKEGFLRVVDTNVTWDNQFLSFFCGVGVPLTLLYLWLAGRMLFAYLRRVAHQDVEKGVEKALTFALLATVVHLFVHDGLLYPQIDWLFHVLLGVGYFSYGMPDAPDPALRTTS